MPLTEAQTAALATLADADPKEVADGLRSVHADAYQHAFRVGYGTAKGEFEPKVAAAKAEAAAAAQERDAAKEALDAASGTDEATAARVAALEKAAADAKAGAEAAAKAAEDRVRSVYRQAEDKAILAGLLAEDVRKDWAEGAVLPKLRDRVRINAVGDDGPDVSYLDADGVPLSGGRDALVKAVAAQVPADYRKSRADGGGGAGPNGSGGADRWAALQAAGKRAAPDHSDSPAAQKRRERLGLPA